MASQDNTIHFCHICKKYPGYRFIWTIESTYRGTETRTNYFCPECERHTRHMCVSKAADLMRYYDTGLRSKATETQEGIHIRLYDRKPRKNARKTS